MPLSGVMRLTGIKTYAYSRHSDLLAYLRLSDIARQSSGLTVCRDGLWVVFFDDCMPAPRIRFTVAHELGHIVLGHLTEPHLDAHIFKTRQNMGDMNLDARDPEEREADMFAARFLAPSVVLWALDVHAADEITALTGLSRQAAEFRARRMEILYKRNRFLLHPLERRVYRQMMPFIQERKGNP